MDTSVLQPTVEFAYSGALGMKFLELAELRNIPKVQRPDLKDWVYWVPFLILPLIGGGLAYAYVMSNVALQPILAVNVGVSAPLILRAMAESNPFRANKIDPGQGA